ncbi:MAG: hypothetical protein U1F30_15040 [Steroidobacteraceae bacterium]
MGDISLQHKYGNGTMVYLTHARYSPAAYNTAYVEYADNDPETSYTRNLGKVGKEDVDHFELGSKGTYRRPPARQRRGVLHQVQELPGADLRFQLRARSVRRCSWCWPAAPRPRVSRLTRSSRRPDTLRIDLNAAYIDAKFTEYVGAPCYNGDQSGVMPAQCYVDANTGAIVRDLSGTMPLSPKFKFVLGAEQRIHALSAGGDIVLGANYPGATRRRCSWTRTRTFQLRPSAS